MLRLRFAIAASVVLAAAVAAAAPPPTTHYRSIGTNADYTVGTVSAVNGETYVIGSLDAKWKTANRGQGDRITIAGVDYTIFSVDAENELTLTEPYAGTTTHGEPYLIARKFKKLKEWEDCIEFAAPCPGVSTASLPTDERVEIGVVYKDAPYLMNTGGEQLKLDSVATSVAYDITLTTTPPNRHHGIVDTGVILDNGIQGSPAIEIRTPFVTIEWIELHHGGTTDQIYVTGIGSNSKVDVHNVMFYDDDQTSNGFRVNDNDAKILFFNNVLYGLEHGVEVNGLLVASSGWFEFYHNTFFQNVVGLNSTTGSPQNNVIVMNGNLAINNGTDFNAILPNATFSNHNWSSDITATQHYGNPNTPPLAVQFTSTLTPVDLHIRRGSIVEDNGASLAAVPDDLDGRARGVPDIGADESESSSANRPKAFTAKAAFDHVQLEWQHPDFGPMTTVEVWRDSATFPSQPGIGVLACTFGAPAPFTKGQCADTGAPPPVNGNTYFYSAFVYDSGGNYSTAANVVGEPFDNTALPPQWSYATGALTLDPAGVRGTAAFAVSNDDFFHAMQGNPGATGGEWPLTGWAPYELPAAVQHRPVIVDIAGNDAALLGAQDGRVYAVDIATGKLVWKSAVLGTSISAAPAALVGNYLATGPGADKVYVGTSNVSSNSLFVLDLMNGDTVTRFDDLASPANIGAVTGVAVRYPSGPVFFTSDDGSGGTLRNVWSLNVASLPAPPTENWSYQTITPVDSGPTRYNGLLLAGTRNGKLYAFNELGPATPLWSTPSFGDGAIKGPIFPVWPNDTVVFTTDTMLHSVQILATGGCGTAPCVAWSQPVGGGSNLSPVLVVPGTNQAFTGDATGFLYEVSLDLGTPLNLPLLVRPFMISSSPLGGPAFSLGQLMLYVSDTSGKVHGIPWPIP